MKVAILGARDRSSLKDRFDSEDIKDGTVNQAMKDVVQRRDKALLTRIIDGLVQKYGRNLTIISVGCDDGIGFLIKEMCMQQGIWFAEVSIHFHGDRRPKPEYTKFYLGRNATVVELADVFFLLQSRNKQSVIDDVVERLKATKSTQPYSIMDEDGNFIETTMESLW